nr:protein bima [Quercus suber]
MSPTNSIASSQLKQLIFYHIDNDLLDNANFLAGRLHALEPRNPDSSHLLALTYLRLRRFKAAFDFSQRYGATGRHLGCAYVFAQACLELGKYYEGCAALEKTRGSWVGKSDWSKHSETSRRHLPDAPAVWTLLAKLHQAHGDTRKAGDCYIEAHKANPFIWDAFDGLCKVGADLNLSNMFRPMADFAAEVHSSSSVPAIYTDEPLSVAQPLAQQNNFNQQVFTPSADPFNGTKSDVGTGIFALPNVKGKSTMAASIRQPVSEWDTPTAGGGLDNDVTMGDVDHNNESLVNEPPAAPLRRSRPGQQFEPSDRPRPPALPGLRGHAHSSSEGIQDRSLLGGQKRTISGHPSQSMASANTDPSAPPRRSNRLFGQAVSSKPARQAVDSSTSMVSKIDRTIRTAKAATGTKGRSGAVGRVVSGNRKIMPPDPAEKEKDNRTSSRNTVRSTTSTMPGVISAVAQRQPLAPVAAADHQAEKQAMIGLLDNFRQLAIGSYATSRFELPKAVQTFKSLPSAQRETPWVLAQLGKAYYESNEYKMAGDCFARVLKLQPSRTEDMEVYSTVLWHLKKESALACLCHNLKDQDFHAAQTWVAVGNAFSLAREHDQAIAAFKRATQLDENFAYAWTLMGHEYCSNEEFEAALSAFRKSVAIDRRAYTGWYGLGRAYQQMGKLEEAERHYRIAAQINPSNSTLLVCIGMVLERLRNKQGALANYARALELAPNSALARFKKARVLMHMMKFDDALEELSRLRDQAPDEANVWFLLGKCYKGLDQKSEALKAFTTALNLDVQAAPHIKEAMEALDEDDEYSEDDLVVSALHGVMGIGTHFRSEGIGRLVAFRNADPPPEGHTKGWKVYLRPLPNGPDITTWLKKVQFKLHHTYQDASRTIEAPGPFEVSETGYGEFGVEIRLYFAQESGEKAVYREHYLVLAPYGSEEQRAKQEQANEVIAERLETIEFNEPTSEMWRSLTADEQWDWLKVKKGRGKGKKPDMVFEGDVLPTAQLPEVGAGQGPGMGAGGAWSKLYEKQVVAQLAQSAGILDTMLAEEKRAAEGRKTRFDELRAAK